MKKEYSKPIVVFEDFALSTNIAGDCEIKTDLQSKNACGVDASGIQVFMTGMTGCFFEVPSDGGGDGEFGNICYHVPYGENVFNS